MDTEGEGTKATARVKGTHGARNTDIELMRGDLRGALLVLCTYAMTQPPPPCFFKERPCAGVWGAAGRLL
jgi:hypothetical protein